MSGARQIFPSGPGSTASAERHALPASLEFPARVLFGVLLAAAASAAIWFGGLYFALFIGIAGMAAAREWHRMLGNGRFGPESVVTGGAIVATVLLLTAVPDSRLALAVLPLGAAATAAIAATRGTSPAWNGAGAFYLGLPTVAAVALRNSVPHGFWIVLYLFLVTWSADCGALFAGKLLKGPKLVPALSPNKTWAGLAGGLLLPAVIVVPLAIGAGGDWRVAAAFAPLLALAGHAGDLFESWVKRRNGRKNSGSLIPGHGGILDRIDSCLFVCVAGAVLVFGIGIDPVFGAWR